MLERRTLKKNKEIAPTQFVGGFPRKGVSIVASKPGVGKTWLVIYNIITLAKQGFKSCTFFGDCPPNVVYDRVNSLADTGEDTPEELKQIYFLTDAAAQKKSMILTSEDGLHNFTEIIHMEKPDIVFIDTFSSLTTIEENSQKDTADLFQKLMLIAEKYNCAIVILHHLRKGSVKNTKGGKVELDDVIGSSIITRLASLVIILDKSSDNSVFLRVVKTWYSTIDLPEGLKILNKDDGSVEIRRVSYQINLEGGAMAMTMDWLRRLARPSYITAYTLSKAVKISEKHANQIILKLLDKRDPQVLKFFRCTGNTRFYEVVLPLLDNKEENDTIMENNNGDDINGSN